MTEHDTTLELIPLYALDALDGDDLRSVELHLESCPECIAELRSMRSVASGLVADEPAPSGVWERIAAEISVPQPEDNVILMEPAREGWGRRLTWLVAAAAIVAVVLGSWAVIRAVSDADPTGTEAIVTAAQDAADDAGTILSEFVVDGRRLGRVVLTPTGDGFVIPGDLAALDQDHAYQLWVVTPDELVISAGLLGNQPVPSRFTWNGDVAAFVLTREVAGGVVSSAGDVVAVAEAGS